MGNRGEFGPHPEMSAKDKKPAKKTKTSSTLRRLVTGGLLGTALSAGGMESTARAEDTSYLSVIKKREPGEPAKKEAKETKKITTEAEPETHLEAADQKSNRILEKYHKKLDELVKDIKLRNSTTFQMNTRQVPLGFYLAQGIIIGEDEFVNLRGHGNTDDGAACVAICDSGRKGVIDRFDRAKEITVQAFEGGNMPKGYEEQEKMFANDLSFLEIAKIFAEHQGLRDNLTIKIEMGQLQEDRGYMGPNALVVHITMTDAKGQKTELLQNAGWLGQEQIISFITSKLKDRLNDLNKIKPAKLTKK